MWLSLSHCSATGTAALGSPRRFWLRFWLGRNTLGLHDGPVPLLVGKESEVQSRAKNGGRRGCSRAFHAQKHGQIRLLLQRVLHRLSGSADHGGNHACHAVIRGPTVGGSVDGILGLHDGKPDDDLAKFPQGSVM